MNRRFFSQLITSLPAAASPSRRPSAPSYGRRTFSSIGKEERPFLGGKEAELLNHEGRGCLTHMWFDGNFEDYGLIRLRVYVDGEKQPSIEIHLGMGHGIGFQDPAAPWGTKHFGKTGAPSGIFNFYRIPFGASIRVTAQLPDHVKDDQVFWWIVRGVDNLPLQIGETALPPSARLKLYKRENYLAKRLEEFDLCSTDKQGMLFQVAMAARSANYHYLEAIMRAYVNGASQPMLLSSGLEDYFLGTYYFNRGLYHTPSAGLTHKDESDFSFAGYRFHDDDPIYFDKGFRLTCRCGEQIGDKIFGPKGNPQPTTYTTYAWTYEW